ncbi:hypothetical protein SAY87_027849 [Trapa incisa]|uniref:Uncharacterized protein n=1 Tax=Trapa incisa TaxID=236973 RepID=A0AAN7KTM5_9MYRT|nr:hypothetical protein SAY87_027849 [Trapa incisa]
MEIAVRPFNSGSIRRYKRRKEHERIHAEIADQKKAKVTRFRGGERRPLFWKMRRIIPKLRWRISSPLNLLARLKNAYVRMMFSLAGNVGSLNTNKVFGSKRIPRARQGQVIYSAHEIESRLVYEIYMALKASPDFPPAASPAPSLQS